MYQTLPRPLSDETRRKLSLSSTATLTNQMLVRGFRNVFIQGVRPVSKDNARMIGHAMTLRCIPAREDIDIPGSFRHDPKHPQIFSVDSIERGQILIVDARGDQYSGVAGSIMVRRMIARGAAGIVTDGGLRDCAEIARLGLPAFCSASTPPTTITRHHAVELNTPIACGNLAVYPNDVVVGDEDGVVVIPHALAEEVANDAFEQERFEQFLGVELENGAPLSRLYSESVETKERYDKWIANGTPGTDRAARDDASAGSSSTASLAGKGPA